jgi:hypothetical protein
MRVPGLGRAARQRTDPQETPVRDLRDESRSFGNREADGFNRQGAGIGQRMGNRLTDGAWTSIR